MPSYLLAFNNIPLSRMQSWLGLQWLMPIILASQEAEIRRVAVQSQPGQIVSGTLSQKKSITKKGLVEWPKVNCEFKSQHCQKKKKVQDPEFFQERRLICLLPALLSIRAWDMGLLRIWRFHCCTSRSIAVTKSSAIMAKDEKL
jgi:hypothetical protein